MTQTSEPDWQRIAATLARAVSATFPEWRVKLTLDTELLLDAGHLLPDLVLSDGFRLAISGVDHLIISDALADAIARGTASRDHDTPPSNYCHRILPDQGPRSAHDRIALSKDLDDLGLDAARTMHALANAKALIDTA